MLRFIANSKIAFVFLAFFLFLPLSSNAEINDSHYDKQWYLEKIGYNYVHDYGLRGQSPIIAVIDSGVNIDHPDLIDNIWINKSEVVEDGEDNDSNGFIDDRYGWNFVENNSNPRPVMTGRSSDDGLNHGTMIAGIISAKTNNGIGISGIASNSKIMALRALDDKGEGKISDVVGAIDYAVKNGASIINLSFSGDTYSEAFESAIERAYKAGVIVVSAVGNKNFDLNENPAYPSCFPSDTIVGVASLNTLNEKADFSSYGSGCVDISAPGVSFFSTSFYSRDENDYVEYLGYWSGTSMSAAVVSGTLALIKEVNPKLSTEELLEVLFKSSDNISMLNYEYGDSLGIGGVNAFNSVRWANERWGNMEGEFLVYPQDKVSDFEDLYKFKIIDEELNVLNDFSNQDSFYSNTSLAIGDIDGDGLLDIVTGAGVNDKPYIKVFDLSGNLKSEFLAYDEKFKGGVSVALGDIDGDGSLDIVTGAGPGGGPHVRIFSNMGELKGQFFAYDEKFKGGVNVALGDTDGDGLLDIVTGAGPGGGPHVRIFSNLGKLKGQFFAYEQDFRGGVKVSVANIYGSDTKRNKEIVVAPGPGRSTDVKIFDNFGKERKSILTYSTKFKGGVNLSIADLDKDGIDEIITGAGPGGTPHIRAFNSAGNLVESFYALDASFSGGVIPVYIEDYK
jgi:hypothetical protein